MIPDKEISLLISHEVPDFAKQNKEILNDPSEGSKKIFNIFTHFTSYTICEIKNHEWRHVKRCFHFAESVYKNGSNGAREAIENIFIFRICTLIDLIENRDDVIDMLPTQFKSLRLKQIYTHGN